MITGIIPLLLSIRLSSGVDANTFLKAIKGNSITAKNLLTFALSKDCINIVITYINIKLLLLGS
jgi:hypothetical protein